MINIIKRALLANVDATDKQPNRFKRVDYVLERKILY